MLFTSLGFAGLAMILALRDLVVPRVFFERIPGDQELRRKLFAANSFFFDVTPLVRACGFLQLVLVASKFLSFHFN